MQASSAEFFFADLLQPGWLQRAYMDVLAACLQKRIQQSLRIEGTEHEPLQKFLEVN